MTPEQYAKSHLANSTHVEGKIEINLRAMPEYKLIPLFETLRREVRRFKAETATAEQEADKTTEKGETAPCAN